MKVVVVGPGGREACLALVLSRHHEVVVTPGNPGIPGSVVTPPELYAPPVVGRMSEENWVEAFL